MIALLNELFMFKAAKAFENGNEVFFEPVYQLLLIDNQMESDIHLLPSWPKLLCKQCLSYRFDLGHKICISLLQCIQSLRFLKLAQLGMT